MDGIYVVMSSASDLVAVIGGERYVARFLFTPAVLRAGNRVWLRIEKQLDGTQEEVAWGAARKGAAADITARVTRLYPKEGMKEGAKGRDKSVLVRPRMGVAFLMTIDEFGAVTPGDEATRARFGGEDGGATVMEEPTEKTCMSMKGMKTSVFENSSDSSVSGDVEPTLRDNNLDIIRAEMRWSA